jgi:hypothetical protein
MTRTALLLSSLFVAACTVGELPTAGGGNPGGNNTTGVDAGNPPATDGGGAHANGCIDRIVPPGDAHQHGGTGGPTHAGEGCVVAACHLASNPGPGAPGFQFAGTVYKPDGTTPSTGVTIQVKSAAGLTAVGVSDSAGNFNILQGSLQQAFPATTNVTACPNLTPMVGQLVQAGTVTGNNCNGCHVTGGSAGSRITIADK